MCTKLHTPEAPHTLTASDDGDLTLAQLLAHITFAGVPSTWAVKESVAESNDSDSLASKVNSNCRYRFLNCQMTTSCFNLRRRDELF
jgi:hypothetical protein